MTSPARQRLDYLLFRGLYLVAGRLPHAAQLAVGRALGAFVWHVVRFRRAVVLDNLQHAFGAERSPDEIRALAAAFYRNLGMTLMEFLAMPRLDPASVTRLVRIEGVEHLEDLRRRGRGALLVSGHFGNWELMGARIAAEGQPVNFIVKTQHNERVDALQNAIRHRVGIGTIRSGANIKDMIRALRRQEWIGMLADQDARSDGIFCDFLGRPASVFRGAAYLAWKLDCPLITGFIYREPDGTHVVRVDPPVEPDRNLDEEEAVRRLTEVHVRRLEAAVRRAPDHYFWLHRRWKTRPPEARNEQETA
ncbi:MAG TPA: lysophospholipid acyltransferase family protein [Candidatus Krumholzibacteria bacterium]|nr:lysophospholipid acyltransferase family protein [Candidatus Krumholzibacteria bacterium]